VRGGAIELPSLPAGSCRRGRRRDLGLVARPRGEAACRGSPAAGAPASDTPGRGEAEIETFADDAWTTPDAGPPYLWVVLRDSRGGVAFAGYAVTIAP
jgi:hypothetical protein